MALAAGTRLGPYEIHCLIGAGGMGEVYEARDTRLGRPVAIKILPSEVAADPDRHRRFEQESRAASALNHPHICVLHDIGSDAGIDYLVMEYLDGQTLAERLAKGPLPIAQVLEYAGQIADALAAAHRAGIVHRDLKPGNVMITKAGTKLLDFGLARLSQAASGPGAASATLSASGTIVGTVPYMAPEQVQGLATDARTDIFAFGAVLYEMLTGKRAFDGASPASVAAAILEHEPASLPSLRPLTPPTLDRIVSKCLAKDPGARWQSAADLAQTLRWVGGAGEIRPASRKTGWLQMAAAVSLVALGAVIAFALTMRFAPSPSIGSPSRDLHLSLAGARLTLTGGGLAISPNGQTVVFAARGQQDDESRLYVRRLDEWEPRPLKDTEKAVAPFFSPDGAWVGFVADGWLKKVPLARGTPRRLCRVGYQGLTRASWAADGRILISQWPGDLLSVSDENGTATPLPGVAGGTRYRWPQLLPDGRTLLFTTVASGHARVVARLPSGDVRTVVDSAECARYLPTGHLVYEQEGHLLAAPFDVARLERTGPSRVVIDDIAVFADTNMLLDYDVSATGTAIYVTSAATKSTLVVADRAGRVTRLNFAARNYSFPSLSPDGRQVAVTVSQPPAIDVWVGNIDGEPLRQVMIGQSSMGAIFSPDGKWLIFTVPGQAGGTSLFRAPSSFSGEPTQLLQGATGQKPTSFVPHTSTLLFNEASGADQRHIRWVDVDRPASPGTFLETSASEIEAAVSPDGVWVAYQQSDGTGRWNVYVRPYAAPNSHRGRQISAGGGKGPLWNPRGGGELFYQTPTALMSVRVAAGQATAPPVKLFDYYPGEEYRRQFDVMPDGDHFLLMEPISSRTELNVITNWFDDLKATVPIPRR